MADGVAIFYREAGNKDNPSLLLLHGFPTSSVMFTKLMTALSDTFHLVAPDYPGFGFSAFPDRRDFDYTFRNIARYMDRFTDVIGLDSFTVYLHDFGCPIGLRICVARPEKIEKIIVQDGNAYMKGIEGIWDEIRDYWAHPTEEKKRKVYAYLSAEGTREQYTAGLPPAQLDRVSPETWILDWERMSRPGNLEMQYGLSLDYQDNIDMFPVFQDYFRTYRPPALVLWGKYEVYYNVAEAFCYRQDLPDAEIHILEGGHMLLETNFDEVLQYIRNFMLENDP